MSIVIVDYHKGNLLSVERGLVGAGADVVVTDEADIDKLRVLRAAGMVQATLPDGPGQSACVTAITGLGHASLRAQRAREVLASRDQVPHAP